MANLCQKCGNCLRVFLLIVAGLGIAFSILTTLSCEFVTGRLATGNKDSQAGLFFWKDPNGDGTCSSWDDPSDMAAFVRTSSVIAPILAGGGMAIIVFQMVCCNICCVDVFTSLALIAASVTQCFTFFMYQTDHCSAAGATCKMGRGGKFSITAAVFFFFCGVAICCTPKSEPLMMREKKDDDDDKEKDEEQPKEQPAEEPTHVPTPDMDIPQNDPPANEAKVY